MSRVPDETLIRYFGSRGKYVAHLESSIKREKDANVGRQGAEKTKKDADILTLENHLRDNRT